MTTSSFAEFLARIEDRSAALVPVPGAPGIPATGDGPGPTAAVYASASDLVLVL